MQRLTDYHQFDGLHFTSGYPHNVLAYQGALAPHTGKPYSEALIMGINGGICAGYFSFEYEGYDPHLHFLTYYPFMDEPGAVFERLAIARNTQQTTNPQKAVANVWNALAEGKPAVVWADIATLGYTELIQGDPDVYMVMPVVVYGYDSEGVHLADRARVALVIPAATFEAARARIKKYRFRMMTLGMPDASRLPGAVEAGIRSCISIFTEDPPVGGKKARPNFGFNAYTRWANLLVNTKDAAGWPNRFAPGRRMVNGLMSAYKYLELYFTGGHGGRGVYADFLDEAAVILNRPALREVAGQFRACAARWDELTMALLPDTVAPLKQARELMRRDYELFLNEGIGSLAKRQQIQRDLAALKADLGTHFPLSEAEAKSLREGLRDRVLAIYDAEQIAIEMLQTAIR